MLVESKTIISQTHFDEHIPLMTLPKKQHPLLRLNAICPYYTMFPLEFPFNALKIAKNDEWVLDPFCGRGTTNFAARLRGLPSIGLDANPVAVAVAQSKFIQTTPARIINICQDIIDENQEPDTIPTGEFWDLCYHPETLRRIAQIRESLLEDCQTSEKRALRAIMLGILHGPLMKGQPSYLSNQMPRTYATKPGPAIKYWNKVGILPKYIDVLDLIKRRTEFVFPQIPAFVAGEAYNLDSRIPFANNLSKKFKWIVTSPPYYGMRTYVPDQWLRNWFVGGPPDVVYDSEELIRHDSVAHFISDLATIWKNVAMVCEPDAHLVIRFGTLPSQGKEPSSILTDSIQKADCGWVISSINSAGNAGRGKRQSDQFLQKASLPCEEIDLTAILE